MRRATGAIAAVVLGLVAARPSRADEAPVGRAAIEGDMLDYYGSERTTGYLFAGVGVASVGAGVALVTRPTDFARGLGGAMLGLGALEILGGAFYVLQVGGEIDRFGGALARDPAAFKRDESAHIHGTTSRFLFYRLSELAVAAAGAGVAVYGFASDRDAWKGIGIGVAGEALTLFALDAFGQSRAHAYEDRVGRFEPSLALSAPGAFAGASLAGSF